MPSREERRALERLLAAPGERAGDRSWVAGRATHAIVAVLLAVALWVLGRLGGLPGAPTSVPPLS